ncbi:MAG: nucleotidyltransferase family protein [Pseudomonadota bacterium]
MSVSAVILAAGLSRRMGARNKLLEEFGGRALIRRVVDAVASVTASPPLVILGHEASRVADALVGAEVRLTTNARFAEGQQSSVAFGLTWVDPAAQTLVALGDQPLLEAADLRALLAANAAEGRGRITVPVRQDPATRAQIRGNPIVIPRARVPEVLAQGPNLACRTFTERNADAVHRWRSARPGLFIDVDTPCQLARLRQDHLPDLAGLTADRTQRRAAESWPTPP